MTSHRPSRATALTYHAAELDWFADYLQRPIDDLLPSGPGKRVLDVGCGNGFWARRLAARGFTVVGIDPSPSGIAFARTAADCRFEQLEVSEDLCDQLSEEPFDIVLSLEVVEHCYSPSTWARACRNALRPGGKLICSTPYHGYLKNLLLSVGNAWDRHLHPLEEGGHIKFWSRSTFERLLLDSGFTRLEFRGAGRFPLVWKSMVYGADRG